MPIVMLVRRADLQFTLPIARLVIVLSPLAGSAATAALPQGAKLLGEPSARLMLRLAGARPLFLGVDRMALVRLPDPTTWAPLPTCPASIGRRFQAMARLDGAWVLLSRDHIRQPIGES